MRQREWGPLSPLGFVRHLGHKFSPLLNPSTVNNGLPVTANPEVASPAGGYGWILSLNQTAPRSLELKELEIDPSSVLVISIPYPPGTTFEITENAATWCDPNWPTNDYTCVEFFSSVGSVDEVRSGPGNTYHEDSDGVLTFRIVQIPERFVGNQGWLTRRLLDAAAYWYRWGLRPSLF